MIISMIDKIVRLGYAFFLNHILFIIIVLFQSIFFSIDLCCFSFSLTNLRYLFSVLISWQPFYVMERNHRVFGWTCKSTHFLALVFLKILVRSAQGCISYLSMGGITLNLIYPVRPQYVVPFIQLDLFFLFECLYNNTY